MYKFFVIAVSAALLLILACNTGKTTEMNRYKSDYNFEEAWKKVDSLERKGQYKSALKIVEKIYDEADKSQNGSQKIKSLFYKGRFTNYLQEDNLESFEKILKAEIEKSKFPDKQIFQSILAEFYDKYLSANHYKISKRTKIEDNTSTDIQTWSASKFIEEANKLYELSISDENLKNVSYKNYDEIFTEAVNTENMRDNIYELLVHRALQYFRNDRHHLPKTTKTFSVNDNKYFDAPSGFVKINLKSDDENDTKYKTLKLFQKLEKFNLNNKDYDELIDIALMRLNFVKQNYTRADKGKLFMNTVNKLIDKYPDFNETAQLYYQKALNMYHKANIYNPNLKWNTKKAHELCDMVIKKFPNTQGKALCYNLKANIDRKGLSVEFESVNLPNENILSKIKYKNVNKAYFKILKIPQNQVDVLVDMRSYKSSYVDKLELLSTWEVDLPDCRDYNQHEVEHKIEPLPHGAYVLVCSNNKAFDSNKGVLSHHIIHVSRLAHWKRNERDDNYLYVVDRKTGEPIQNAEVQLSYEYWNRNEEKFMYQDGKIQNTNSEGFIKLEEVKKVHGYRVKIRHKGDTLELSKNIYPQKAYVSTPNNKIIFFTDRSIYRPGQTVYYKGIYVNYKTDGVPTLEKNRKKVTVVFKDVNYQRIEKQINAVNEYGSFNGSFTIPTNGLTGNMYIKEQKTGSRISVKVEEYKRPKFEVEFEEYTKRYKLGDLIELVGNSSSFTGFPLQGAKVVYTVKRKVFYPYYYRYWFPPNSGDNIEIAHGDTKTDEDGKFKIPVNLYFKDVNTSGKNLYFTYEIKADVTDISGETHSSVKIIKAGTTEVNINLSLPKEITERDQLKLEVNTTNYSGKKVNAKGKITIYELEVPNKIFRKRFWTKPDTFLYNHADFSKLFPSYSYKNEDKKEYWNIKKTAKTIDFNTEKNDIYKVNLPVGSYRIVLEFDDPSGKAIKIEKYTSVYSDKAIFMPKLFLTKFNKNVVEPGNSAKINLLTSLDELFVYTTLIKRNYQLFEKKWSAVKGNSNIDLPINESMRGDIFAVNTYVYNNRFYQNQQKLSIPWSNKKLNFEYTSFRSKLYPGQDEEWRIKISGNNNDKIMGELLANIYDASLDDIYLKDWSSSISYPQARVLSSTGYGFITAYGFDYYSSDWKRIDREYFKKKYRELNWFNFSVSNRSGRGLYNNLDEVVVRSAGLSQKRSAMPPSRSEKAVEYDEEMLEMEVDDISVKGSLKKPKKGTGEQTKIRSNMNETVFFFPEINVGENGEYILKFKMNDALTKWKFRMFAHTKDLKFGYDEREIITQKELMITPNNPRFVREGDDLVFKARIDNLVDEKQSGNSWIEIYDAVTMDRIDDKFISSDVKKSFSLEPKGSAMVSWNLDIPKNVSNMLIIRFYANAGNYSDAEELLLPILTNQKLVTETLPLWVRGNNTKDFTFKSLKNSKGEDLKNISYTVEATSHPIWFAIQSLPYLNDIKFENSISIVNAIFSNSLAKKIVDDNPKIKRVFDKWKKSASPIDKDALLSNLSKNQELKNVLLEETPWVLDAIDEETRKKNIALLFDLNQVKNDKKMLIQKLIGLQNPDGGFSWFSGGSSRYITQYVVEMIGKMKEKQILDDSYKLQNMTSKAIKYINKDVEIHYKKLLKKQKKGEINMKDNHLGSLQIHYLYTIQFFPDVKMEGTLKEAYDYYIGQAKKYWLNRSLYLKGMLAIILHNEKEVKTSKEILLALEEQSIVSEELGRYWKSYHGYYWYQFPIETQALMIEAFKKINNDDKIVDELKIWLLKNKQTNSWKTGKATAAAIYALLSYSGNRISETEIVKIYLDNKDITKDLSANDLQAGTGYYKIKLPKNEINSNLGDIKIENPNKDIAWGAVYWQYLQDRDKIEAFEETPLKIQRFLYLVKNTDKGEVMKELKKGQKLHTGDLIKVKIRLQVDRQMEFVHIADERAATFEPIEQISKYNWQGDLGYYQNPRDTKMNFFIDFLPRGVFVLEYPLRVTQSGDFSNGIAEFQCYYAPEFSSHSGGMRVEVE